VRGTGTTCLYDCADGRASPRAQEGRPARQANRQCRHLRAVDFARSRTGSIRHELLGICGGRMRPLMSHLIESGKLTANDMREAEGALRRFTKKVRADD